MQHAQIRGGTVYSNTARFDTNRPLTEDELRKMAPSIFATTAHESRSERFKPVPTIEILRGLQKEGFEAVGARQSLTRVEGKADYTKHLVRLRRLDNQEKYKVGDTVFEMLLKNANDGTAAFDLLAALWRIRCMNSLVTKIDDVDSVKVYHTGKNVAQDVVEGTYRVVEQSARALAAPQDWSQIKVPLDAAMALAEAAHGLRFADNDGVIKTPIKAEQFLMPRRADDRGDDLWTRFNVIQEHALQGGDEGFGRDANNRRRKVTTRGIRGIDEDVKLNRSLWVLGERMAGLLKAA
jgi:hypothetical protein